MGFPKMFIAWIAILIALVGVWAEEEKTEAGEIVVDSGLKLELEQLRAKVSALETSIKERAKESKNKDDDIAKLEKVIQEKSELVSSLQNEVAVLQKKGAVDAEGQARMANARANGLEKQLEKLRNEISAQNKKKEALESRASEAEEEVQKLNSKLESLQKTSEEQKRRIQKTVLALQVAEEELMRTQLEATAKSKELTEVHGAWLPPWLATHTRYYSERVTRHWNEHTKPAFEILLQKASEKSVWAQKWAEPHLETVKTKLIPVKESWLVFVETVEPYARRISSKSIEVYEASMNAIAPQAVKVQEIADPYVQEAKRFSKPYIDHVAKVTKPHVEKVRVAAKPYTKRAVHAYGKFLKSATTYHHQIQKTVSDHLNKHEVTKPLATKELVWFMASALLALPVFFLYKIFSDVFRVRKGRKPTQNSHANLVPRRNKRRHAEK